MGMLMYMVDTFLGCALGFLAQPSFWLGSTDNAVHEAGGAVIDASQFENTIENTYGSQGGNAAKAGVQTALTADCARAAATAGSDAASGGSSNSNVPGQLADCAQGAAINFAADKLTDPLWERADKRLEADFKIDGKFSDGTTKPAIYSDMRASNKGAARVAHS